MTIENEEISKIRRQLDDIWDSMVTDPARALSDSLKVEKESVDLGYSRGIKDSRLYQSWCLIYLARLREAIEILTDLSGDYKNNEDCEEYIRVLNALGVAYNDLGDNTNAFYYYSKSLKLSRKAGLLKRELSVLNNMGGYYLENKSYNKALNHYLEIYEKTDDTDASLEIKAVVLINIGICYSNLKKYDKAEYYLLQGRALSQKLKSRVNDVDCLHELAEVKFRQNDLVSSGKYIEEALILCSEIDNKRLECDLLIKRGNIENKVSFYEKAYSLSKQLDYKQAYQISSLKLAEHFEETGDYRKSLEFLKEHYKTEKETDNTAAEKKFHNLEMEYEIERNKKNAELFKIQNLELKESLNWMTILNKIARETMSSLELDSIFTSVYRNINILMDAELFHVVFYNKENDNLNVVKAFENGIEIPPFTYTADENSSFAAWSIKNKKEVFINNLDKEYNKYIKNRAYYGDGPRAKSHLTVPIFMRNDEMGVLAILSYYENAYKEEHIQLLKSLASFLAIAIDNSRNYEKVNVLNKIIQEEKEELEAANKKITELATHDNLTGLTNRRVFNEILESAMEQAKRRGENLAVLFIDLDNFKPVNDTWGHNAGDRVLVEIAGRLKNSLRATDSVARIGGDEFLILLNPVGNRMETEKVTNKIIRKIAEPIKIGEQNINIGMSIGISLYPDRETSADQLIINADSAMYKIKKGKKNGMGFYKKD